MCEERVVSAAGRRWSGLRVKVMLCAASSLAVTLAACSSSGNSKTSSGNGASDATGKTASGTSACVSGAKQALNAGMAPMTMPKVTAIKTSTLSGKRFAVVSLTAQSSLNQAQAQGIKNALATVGASTTVYDGKGTPNVIAQAFQSAIGNKVAGIVTLGLDPSSVKTSIADAKTAGIPVVIGSAVKPDTPHLPGVVANVAVDSTKQGVLQADYALATTNCKLHALTIFTSAGPVTVNHADGAQAEIKRLCGSACSLKKIDVSAATFATTLAGQVQTTIQRAPNINFILSSADLFNSYILQGLKALGKNVPIGGSQGDTLAQAQAGKAQVVDIQWPPGLVNGWCMADAVMRGVLGSANDVELPLRVLDKDNWGTSVAFAAQYPKLVDYQQVFKAAWGVGK